MNKKGSIDDPVVFRSRFRTNLAPLIIFIGLLSLALCIGFLLPFGLDALVGESGRAVAEFIFSSPLGLLLGLATVGIAYLGVYLWSDTLVLTPTQLQHRSVPFPLAERRTIKFDEVLQVRHTMRGVLLIETAEREAVLIRVGGYEGGEARLLQELESRIDQDRLTPETRSGLWRRTNADYWSLGLSLAAVTIFLIAWGWSNFQDRGRAGIAWNVGARMSFDKEIESFTFGPKGSVWALIREGFQFDRTENYQVVQYLEGDQLSKPLLDIAKLLPGQSDKYTYPSQVLVDSNGRPWLVFRFLDQILFWEEGKWDWVEIPQLEGQGYIERFVASENAFWGVHFDELMVVEPRLLAVWKVPGFSGQPSPEYQLFESPFGGFVSAYFSTGATFISRLALSSDGLEWIEVTVREGIEHPDRRSTLLTSSLGGTVYLMSWTGAMCSDGELIVQIGKLPSRGSGWSWQSLDLYHDCDSPIQVDGFLVDTQERIWISTPEGVRVYDGVTNGDFGVNVPTEITHYTESNSGYFQGEIRQDSRGRIWSLDEGGKFLVWVDANSETLPSALPGSIAALMGAEWIPLVLQYLGILTILSILLVVRGANRFKGVGRPTSKH